MNILNHFTLVINIIVNSLYKLSIFGLLIMVIVGIIYIPNAIIFKIICKEKLRII